jgi:hypothetical protein
LIFPFYDFPNLPIPDSRKLVMAIGLAAAAALSLAVFHFSVRRGIKALISLAS